MTGVPLYRWLVPRVVYPLADRLGGRRVWSEVRRLSELQWRPRTELETRTLERLRPLLVHAAANVPYYRELFRQAGVAPEDIRTLADLAHVPITTKAQLRAGFPARTTAENLPAHRAQKMTTSGSTGLPFEFYWDRSARDMLSGAYLFSLQWAGVGIWDTRIAILIPSAFATNTLPSSQLTQLTRRVVFGEHSLRLPADELTGTALRGLVESIARGRRYFIRGYPSAIAWLGRQLAQESAPLPSYPQVVITYAESLTGVNAQSIREAFRCPVVNYYTAWDIPGIAQTCPDNPAALHVSSDRLNVRVVRADGSDATPGEPGRVVVTDFANYVMPFINYAIGDYAVAGAPCPCGRGFPTLASVEGRDAEVIRTPAGRQISGVVLGHFLAFVAGVIPYVFEYQAVQVALDAVTLRVVPTPQYSLEFEAILNRRLEGFLGPGVSVTVEVMDRIPLEPSGKRFIIKSELREPRPSRRPGILSTADPIGAASGDALEHP